MARENMVPLHKATHFRRLRAVINAMAKKANVNISKYNLENMTCYRTNGENMLGKNTELRNFKNVYSCFVADNDYEIYECPNFRNKEKGIGNFLMIAHNTSFNYWMMIIMDYKVTVKNNKTYVKVIYDTKFNAGYISYKDDSNIRIQSFDHPRALNLGANHFDHYFDIEFNREEAYKYTIQNYTLKHINNNNFKISTDQAIKKTRKSSNNRSLKK